MSDENYKVALAEMMRNPDPAQREAFAQVLVEFLQPGHLTNEVLSLLLNTRSLNAGDVLVKKIRKGINVRTLVPGAVHLANEITISDRINFVLDGADVKVNYNEWELERGEIGTVDSISSEMRAKLADYFVNKVFTSLSSIWTVANTPNNYTNLGTAITGPALINAIDRINLTTPGAKLIVGSRAAVTPITTFAAFWTDGVTTGWSEKLIEQIYETGWLGKYYGVPILALEQVYDNPEDYQALIPENKVLVIGQKVGEFITYGDVKTKQWVDNNPTPPMWNLELYQQFGMIVDNANGIYVIDVV